MNPTEPSRVDCRVDFDPTRPRLHELATARRDRGAAPRRVNINSAELSRAEPCRAEPPTEHRRWISFLGAISRRVPSVPAMAVSLSSVAILLSLNQLYFMAALVSWITTHNALSTVALSLHRARCRRIRSVTSAWRGINVFPVAAAKTRCHVLAGSFAIAVDARLDRAIKGCVE